MNNLFTTWLTSLLKINVLSEIYCHGMGMNRLGHVVFRGYVFAELVQTYNPRLKNRSSCVKINHLLDTEHC